MAAKFNFVIPDDLLERIKIIAEKKEVSIASIINMLLSDYANGIDRLAMNDLEERVSTLEREVEILKDKK